MKKFFKVRKGKLVWLISLKRKNVRMFLKH